MGVYIAAALAVFCTGVFYVLMCTSPKSGPGYFFNAVLGPRLMGFVKALPFGERAINGFAKAFDYFFWQRNPLLQIFYVILLAGGFGVGVWEVFPRVPNMYLAEYHRLTFSAVFFAALHSFFLACTTPPGYITEGNLKKYSKYEYDNMMYTPRKCRTTGILKPARSKYCTIMKRNVARFDHYCGWLAQPVGEENYRFFLLFLLMTSVMLLYAFAGIFFTILALANERGVWSAVFINRHTGQKHKATYLMILQWTISNYNTTVGIGLLTGVMGVVVLAFFCYHVFLASRNRTTNETFKWAEYKDMLAEADTIVAEGQKRVEAAKEEGGGTKANLTDLPKIPKRFLDVLEGHESIKDVKYFYNLGVWQNFREVLFPRSLRAPPIPPRDATNAHAASSSVKTKEAGGETGARDGQEKSSAQLRQRKKK